MDAIKEKRALCVEICVSVFCTWAMGGSPRHRGDSLVLTADDAIMLPLASQPAARPALVWPADRKGFNHDRNVGYMHMRLRARASKSARAKHVEAYGSWHRCLPF